MSLLANGTNKITCHRVWSGERSGGVRGKWGSAMLGQHQRVSASVTSMVQAREETQLSRKSAREIRRGRGRPSWASVIQLK